MMISRRFWVNDDLDLSMLRFIGTHLYSALQLFRQV